MRLCRCSWFCWIIFLLFSANVNAVTWSSVGFDFWLDEYGDSKNKGDLDLSKCKLNPSLMEEEGNKSDGGEYVESRYSGGMFLIVHYGKTIEGKKYGRWGYAQRFTFPPKLSDNYKKPLFSALKKALSAGNCDIANAILDAMQNPNIKKDAQGDDYLSFENNGDTCIVKSNGSSKCEWHSIEKDEEGKPRITLDPNKDGSINDYASSSVDDKPNNNDGKNGDKNIGNGGVNERRGSGSSSNNNGTSSTGGNNNSSGSSSANQGKGDGTGDKGGSGIGNGKGDGDGDDEGKNKGELPKLEEFNIGDSLQKLKGKLMEMIDTSSCNISGKCPSIDVSLFGTTHSINIHCKIFEDNGEKIRTAFNFLWVFLGILIILSA